MSRKQALAVKRKERALENGMSIPAFGVGYSPVPYRIAAKKAAAVSRVPMGGGR